MDTMNIMNTSLDKIVLHEDLLHLIWKTYFSIFIVKAINDIRISRYNNIVTYIYSQISIHVDESQDTNSNTNLDLSIIWDLTDIGDFTYLSHIHKKFNKYSYNFNYHWFSIAITLEQFYLNTLLEQQIHIKNALSYIPKYNFLNPQIDYFTKLYSNFIDYKDNHSGSSFGFCITNITGFIMKNKADKLTLWSSLLYHNIFSTTYNNNHTHLYNNTYNNIHNNNHNNNHI